VIGLILRLLVAAAIAVVIVRFGFRSMRTYVQGGMREKELREAGPPPTMEVTGEFRLRCRVCGLEVQVCQVPENDGGPFDLPPLRHCREEMMLASEIST
jgi:hypothetical protein